VAREIAVAHPDANPVILGPPDDACHVLDVIDSNSDMSIERMLEAASQFDVDAWIAARPAELWGDEEPPPLPFENAWPDEVRPTHTLDSLRDGATRQPYEQIIIVLLPTTDPTAAAAHLKFGGWNHCPDPIVHIAFARRWHARYGAHLVANTGDVLEFRVQNPVGSREDAIRLAVEQYHYCEDIVEQGTQTIERLAAELLGATAWFFWWD